MRNDLKMLFPSLHLLTEGEQAELDRLIFELKNDESLLRFLELYSMATQVVVASYGGDANYELGNRDCIMRIRNLLLSALRPPKEE